MKDLTQMLFLSLLLACSIPLFAQQSSKSKAANKIYEKGIKIINARKINSDNLDFSPSFYQNGIVFASSRYKSGERDKKIDETYFELFYADLDIEGQPMEPREFSIRVNSHLHEGPVSFSRDGQTIYFTRNNIEMGKAKANSKGQTGLKIYEAQKGKSDWKNVRELPFNDDEYNVAHPSLSPDGSKLYFTSDMPGGYGGMDLYVVEKIDGEWSLPVNLGEKVNTKKNELFPFMHSSGYLFFASNGHKGAGGLDLFMVEFDGDYPTEVRNMGEPFNSKKDDLGLILGPDGRTGFFASSRDGGKGKDDIYLFEAKDGIWGLTKPKTVRLRLSINDEQSGSAIAGAKVWVFEETPQGWKDRSGNILYETLLIPKENDSEELVFTNIKKDAAQADELALQSDESGSIYYDMINGKNYLIWTSKEGYANQEIRHTAVTSGMGEGLVLSLQPITCTKLSGQINQATNGAGIASAVVRIKSACTGEEEVLLTNEQGQFDFCLPLNCDYTIIGQKEQFAMASQDLSAVAISNGQAVKTTISLKAILSPIKKEDPIDAGSVIVLENIYYDFNKSAIRSSASRGLDDLLQLMQQYPNMTIELSSHTDSRGSEAYNRQLSADRAESAMQYLVSRGIQANRIRAIGYGESRLRNHCRDGVSCSEDEHQYNRRTEVKVINK